MSPFTVTARRRLVEYLRIRASNTDGRERQAWSDAADALTDLPESGGTVGPLPDGTTIPVEPVGPDPSKCGSPEHAETESAQRSPDPRRSP